MDSNRDYTQRTVDRRPNNISNASVYDYQLQPAYSINKTMKPMKKSKNLAVRKRCNLFVPNRRKSSYVSRSTFHYVYDQKHSVNTTTHRIR